MRRVILCVMMIIQCFLVLNAQTSWEALHYKSKKLQQDQQWEEALKVAERAIVKCAMKYGQDHYYYSLALGQKAHILIEMGAEDEGFELYKRSITHIERALGKEDTVYAIRLNNLGILYLEAGKYKEALPFFKKAFEHAEKHLGKTHPAYMIRLSNLAYTYEMLDDFGKAINSYEALIKLTNLKQHQDKRGLYVKGLAELYTKLKRFDKAYTLLSDE